MCKVRRVCLFCLLLKSCPNENVETPDSSESGSIKDGDRHINNNEKFLTLSLHHEKERACKCSEAGWLHLHARRQGGDEGCCSFDFRGLSTVECGHRCQLTRLKRLRFHQHLFVYLWAGLHQKYSTDFQKIQWKSSTVRTGHGRNRFGRDPDLQFPKKIEFDNLVRVMVWAIVTVLWRPHNTPRHRMYFIRCLFSSKNFARSPGAR